MQHRYTGDIGDYLKLALLRAIPGGLRVAVCWWLHPDEDHNGDGRHISYLDQPWRWRQIDSALYDGLSKLVRTGGRSVRALENSSFLRGMLFHSDPVPSGREHAAERAIWFHRLISNIEGAGVLFLDPDNGIDLHADAAKRCSAKHVTLQEITALGAGDRTQIIYHHQTRAKGGHSAEIFRLKRELEHLSLGSVTAIRARPFSPRVFFVIGPNLAVHDALSNFAKQFPEVFEVFDREGNSPANIAKVSTWKVNVITLYPEMFPGPLGHSLAGRALGEGVWSLDTVQIRDFAIDKHRTVDDTPAGGGAGMVLRVDVLASAVDFALGQMNEKKSDCPELVEGPSFSSGAAPKEQNSPSTSSGQSGLGQVAPPIPLLAMTPRGKPLTQARVRELAAGPGVIILCGRFEGFDERIFEGRPIEQVSLGDIVLSGGEPAALALLDACIRLLPGVMGAPSSGAEESFEDDLLEYPHYTRPQEWEGRTIPEVLRSGDHAKIAAWRQLQSEIDTRSRRPDLWERHEGARAQSASGARRKKKDMDQ